MAAERAALRGRGWVGGRGRGRGERGEGRGERGERARARAQARARASMRLREGGRGGWRKTCGQAGKQT
eukprot:6209038-Pleurochrysis_carterae.AAC.1